MNSRSVAIFAVVVVVLVGVSVWYLNSPFAPHYPNVEPTPTPAPQVATPPVESPRTADFPPTRVPKAQPKPVLVPTPPPVVLTEDDIRISNALEVFKGDTDADNDKTAGLLVNLLPSLTKDGQVECAQHITNLISDAQFLPKLNAIWRNAQFNPDVLEVIGNDLNNRADKIKMPAWLDAVKNPAHPFHEEAKNNLAIYLDEDYENNFQKWEQGVKKYLENQAKEEAEAEK